MSDDFKVVDTEALTRLIKLADTWEFNRRASDELVASLDPDGLHVCSLNIPHVARTDGTETPRWPMHRRCVWLCKTTGVDEAVQLVLDVTQEDFDALRDYQPNPNK